METWLLHPDNKDKLQDNLGVRNGSFLALWNHVKTWLPLLAPGFKWAPQPQVKNRSFHAPWSHVET